MEEIPWSWKIVGYLSYVWGSMKFLFPLNVGHSETVVEVTIFVLSSLPVWIQKYFEEGNASI